jgi:hypothetical protein
MKKNAPRLKLKYGEKLSKIKLKNRYLMNVML